MRVTLSLLEAHRTKEAVFEAAEEVREWGWWWWWWCVYIVMHSAGLFNVILLLFSSCALLTLWFPAAVDSMPC